MCARAWYRVVYWSRGFALKSDTNTHKQHSSSRGRHILLTASTSVEIKYHLGSCESSRIVNQSTWQPRRLTSTLFINSLWRLCQMLTYADIHNESLMFWGFPQSLLHSLTHSSKRTQPGCDRSVLDHTIGVMMFPLAHHDCPFGELLLDIHKDIF